MRVASRLSSSLFVPKRPNSGTLNVVVPFPAGGLAGEEHGRMGDMLVAETGLILRSFKLRRREPHDHLKI